MQSLGECLLAFPCNTPPTTQDTAIVALAMYSLLNPPEPQKELYNDRIFEW